MAILGGVGSTDTIVHLVENHIDGRMALVMVLVTRYHYCLASTNNCSVVSG